MSYMCFQKKLFIKMGSCYCKCKTKEKSVLCNNSVISILLGSWYYLLRRRTHNFTYTDVANTTTI